MKTQARPQQLNLLAFELDKVHYLWSASWLCKKQSPCLVHCFCFLSDLILYVPSSISQLYRDGSSCVEPVLSSDKCVLLNDHNAVTAVRLKPAALRSRVKHSTTEQLIFLATFLDSIGVFDCRLPGVLICVPCFFCCSQGRQGYCENYLDNAIFAVGGAVVEKHVRVIVFVLIYW